MALPTSYLTAQDVGVLPARDHAQRHLSGSDVAPVGINIREWIKQGWRMTPARTLSDER